MYHITEKGEPGVCRARQGKCPFGNADEHYASASEARYAFEKRMNEKTPSLSKVKKRFSDLPISDEVHDNTFNQEEHSIDYTPEQVLAKFKKDIAGHTYALSETNNPGEPGLILERLFGKEPDADPTADLGTVELKTLRKGSIRRPISLGSLAMNGNSKELQQKYLGHNFQRALKAGEWTKVGKNYYTLYVDRKSERVRLIIANEKKEFVSTNDYGWDFSRLGKKVEGKLSHIAVGMYETHEEKDGSRSVTFDNIVIGGFTKESMIDKLESGDVRMEFRFSPGGYHRTTLTAPLKNFAEKASLEETEAV